MMAMISFRLAISRSAGQRLWSVVSCLQVKSGNQIYKANSACTQICHRALLLIVVRFALRAGPHVEAVGDGSAFP